MQTRSVRRLTLILFLTASALAGPSTAHALTVLPSSATVAPGADRRLTAYNYGVPTTAVRWSVNGVVGGNATVGTIDDVGKYTAPLSPPGYSVKATATSLSNRYNTGSTWITVRSPTPTATRRPEPTSTSTRRIEPTPTFTPTRTFTVRIEPTRTFTMRVEPTRTPTATVPPTSTNTIRIEPTATPTVQVEPTRTATARPTSTPTMRMESSPTGTIRTEPTRTFTSSTARTPTATPRSDPTPSAIPTATSTPDPLAITYGRFLDQTTFGATQQLTAHLAQIGIPAFLDEQLAMPESPWPPLATAQRADAVDAFFGNALGGQDQLRQRVVFALSEVIVEAMNKNTNGNEIVPWLQLLSRNAFGNYRTLLAELTLDASMGKYLDLANSGVMGGAANENYPREVMQLFSIGLYQLNPDGSVRVNAQGAPLPTYSQTDVQQVAKALTGWTYGNPSGVPPAYGNSNYYPGPMLPVATRHNTSAKTVLDQTIPASQSAQQDLDDVIDILFEHPNVGPFLAIRLIHGLVTSNPSPAYVARVAAAFDDDGTGRRGEMESVIRAILLDPEARNDTPPSNFGRLRTPMQHTIALARALNLNLGAASQFAYLFYGMNEGLLDAASVFGHYSPSYRIPKTTLVGPEFQIYSASDAVNRANFFYYLMYQPWPINPALQPFVQVAGNASALVDAVDRALLFGRMSASTRSALLTAVAAMPDNNARVLTALYLTSMSGEYLIQR